MCLFIANSRFDGGFWPCFQPAQGQLALPETGSVLERELTCRTQDTAATPSRNTEPEDPASRASSSPRRKTCPLQSGWLGLPFRDPCVINPACLRLGPSAARRGVRTCWPASRAGPSRRNPGTIAWRRGRDRPSHRSRDAGDRSGCAGHISATPILRQPSE